MVAYHLYPVKPLIRKNTALCLPVHERLKSSHCVGFPVVKLNARARGDSDHKVRIAEIDAKRMNMAKREKTNGRLDSQSNWERKKTKDWPG